MKIKININSVIELFEIIENNFKLLPVRKLHNKSN